MQAHEGTASFYVGSALIGFNRNKILFMDATGCRRSRYGGRRIRWVRKMILKCIAVVRPSKWKSKNCQPNDFLTLPTGWRAQPQNHANQPTDGKHESAIPCSTESQTALQGQVGNLKKEYYICILQESKNNIS